MMMIILFMIFILNTGIQGRNHDLSNSNMTSWPTTVPHDTSGLRLFDNFLTTIPNGALANLSSLKTLEAQDNSINESSSGDTIAIPSSLQILDFSRNRFTEFTLRLSEMAGNMTPFFLLLRTSSKCFVRS